MRVLIASTEGAGHFGPLVPFIEALTRRGDDVLVVAPPGLAGMVEAAGYRFRGGAEPPAEEVAAIWKRVGSATAEEAAVLVNREIFGRLDTAAMLPTLERACDEWPPDLILRDPCEYASALVAERRGISHAQVAISLAEVEAGSLKLAAGVLAPYRRGFVEALEASPYLTRFPGSMDASPFPHTIRYREPRDAPASALPGLGGDDDRPLIYATLGSVAGTRTIATAAYRTVIEAVGPLPARVLLTIGRDTDPSSLGPLPENLHVEPWVPQHDVLPHATLVVCHGGSGTAFGALAVGVPLVILPLFADQPVNARLVSDAGAGVTVSPHEPAARLRDAIRTVLGNSAYRAAAARIADEMNEAYSIDDALRDLAPPGPPQQAHIRPVQLRDGTDFTS
jgi:UDP:flavonoid glycosyltransferase YjiC (YdhE family)